MSDGPKKHYESKGGRNDPPTNPRPSGQPQAEPPAQHQKARALGRALGEYIASTPGGPAVRIASASEESAQALLDGAKEGARAAGPTCASCGGPMLPCRFVLNLRPEEVVMYPDGLCGIDGVGILEPAWCCRDGHYTVKPGGAGVFSMASWQRARERFFLAPGAREMRVTKGPPPSLLALALDTNCPGCGTLPILERILNTGKPCFRISCRDCQQYSSWAEGIGDVIVSWVRMANEGGG